MVVRHVYITRLKVALNITRQTQSVLTKTYSSLNSWRIPFAMILKSLNKVEFHLCMQQLPTGETNLKGCGMGPCLVLASPCFRQNVVATCKIGSFSCSLDNLLQKNAIVLFFGNQISKWRSFEKRAIFDLLFTFFSHQGKVTKSPSAHISHTYIHIFCSPYWLFLPYQFRRKYEFVRYGFSLVWVLALILIRAILEQSINNKIVSKI